MTSSGDTDYSGAILGVPEPLHESLSEFVRERQLRLQLTSGDGVSVRIAQSDEPHECNARTLCTGGWISCSVAHEVARTLDLAPRQFGQLLDFLDIKVRMCDLGLF